MPVAAECVVILLPTATEAVRGTVTGVLLPSVERTAVTRRAHPTSEGAHTAMVLGRCSRAGTVVIRLLRLSSSNRHRRGVTVHLSRAANGLSSVLSATHSLAFRSRDNVFIKLQAACRAGPTPAPSSRLRAAPRDVAKC